MLPLVLVVVVVIGWCAEGGASHLCPMPPCVLQWQTPTQPQALALALALAMALALALVLAPTLAIALTRARPLARALMRALGNPD